MSANLDKQLKAIALASKNEQKNKGTYVNPSADSVNRTSGTGKNVFSFGSNKKQKIFEQGDKLASDQNKKGFHSV